MFAYSTRQLLVDTFSRIDECLLKVNLIIEEMTVRANKSLNI
ncbi:hypothetical protein [uncultured Shewanella sp.]|nr:hypothetical protein [uncultured Shewanella sp.]